MKHYVCTISIYLVVLQAACTIYSAANNDLHRLYMARGLGRLSGTKWRKQNLDMSAVNDGKPSHYAAFMRMQEDRMRLAYQRTQTIAKEAIKQKSRKKRNCCPCVVL